jgi:hypothetical protein
MLTKIAMPFDGYAEMLVDKTAQDCAPIAKRLLPGIYGRMVADGGAQEINLRPYLPAGQVPSELYKWAHSRVADYSLEAKYVEKRAQRAALYSVAPLSVRGASLIKVAGAAEVVARGYALYKLAFLQALQDSDRDFALTSILAIRQNYLQ